MRVLRAIGRRRRIQAVAVATALLALGAVPALAFTAGTYRGKTSQHRCHTASNARTRCPVLAVLGAHVLKKFTITWFARCPHITPHPFGPLKTFQTNWSLGRHGWSGSSKYTAPPIPGNPVTEKFAVKDHATITGKTIHGVFTGTAKLYKNSNSKLIGTCTSGKITFTLKRP
jgi:hypothetical protein